MAGQYLEDSYKIDSKILKEEIRKETVIRKTVKISTIMDADDLQIDIESLTDDLVINMGLDPVQARKSIMALSRVTKTVPVLDMEFQWSPSQKVRINKSKIGIGARKAKAVGIKFPEIEDGLFLATTLTGSDIGDVEPIAKSGNYTTASAHLDVTTYSKLKETLADMIGQLIDGLGNIKKYPLYLYVTPNVYNLMLGISNDTSDRNGVEYANATLKTSGSSASEVIVTENLGCTVTKDAEGVKITATGSSNALLMASDGKFQTIFASAFKDLIEDTPVRGHYSKVYERWLPTIHEIKAGIYSDTVVVA